MTSKPSLHPESQANSSSTYERRRKFVTQIHADLVFQTCISFLRCFRTPVAPIRTILVYPGMLPCLVPSRPQIMQIRISFRSRSDLVLDAEHSLDFCILSRFAGVYLVL